MGEDTDTARGAGAARAAYAAAITALGAAAALRAGGWAAAGIVAFAVWCTAAGLADLRALRLPDALTLPGAAAVLAVAGAAGHLRAALAGAVLLAGVHLVLHLARPRALGAGDVKLALGIGAATALGGGAAWALSAFAAPVCTATAGLAAAAVRGGRPAAVPHGASMCAAALVGLLVGG